MTIEDLKEYGANVQEGIDRCAGMPDFYLRLAERVKQEKGFEKLESAIKEKRLKDGFEAAHALKGVLGNLALTPMYEPIREITELLRVETDTDYMPLLNEILEQKRKFDLL